MCLFLPPNTFGAPANGAATLWGWCHPQIPLPMVFGIGKGSCLVFPQLATSILSPQPKRKDKD